MPNLSKLRIVTELGELVYKEASDLNLSFSRIVDDFTDISNRFGDFSYEFYLPIVKRNSDIFGSPETVGSKNYFPKNRSIQCRVYNNQEMLLDGLINLEGVTKDSYKCKFYSKFKELIDVLNEKTSAGTDKTLKNLNFPVVSGWDYESSIINHIRADYKDSDETFYQYPLSFYSTFYCEYGIYSGVTDFQGYNFSADVPKQNYYYLFNSVGSYNNRIFYHQVPPGVYLVSIVEQILKDAGWGLGGQFFNGKDIKKILLLYNGTDDIYDQATQIVSGSTALDLQIAKFLPDMGQADFLKGVINMFNLYFRVDTNNKIVEFETYDTYFRNTDGVNPYDITTKINISGSETGFSYIENNNPSILFKDSGNRYVFGDNKVMSGATDNATSTVWVSTSDVPFNQTFNRVGYTEKQNTINTYGSTVQTIDIPFAEPTIKRQYIWNDYDIDNISQSATTQIGYLPILSKQSITDNNSMKFNKKDTDNYLFNNESSIKFQGDACFMYYYGHPTTDFENKSGKGPLSDYLYYNMYTGSTEFRVPIPIVSPFQLNSYRDSIESWLNQVSPSNLEDRRTVVASYLQALWQMMGSNTAFNDTLTTDFSLVFDDNGYFHETLWSKFHKYKWDRYQQSELFTGTILMNSYDWNQMQINRPLKFRGELYSLVSIEGFNPIEQTAQIKMIKKL